MGSSLIALNAVIGYFLITLCSKINMIWGHFILYVDVSKYVMIMICTVCFNLSDLTKYVYNIIKRD